MGSTPFLVCLACIVIEVTEVRYESVRLIWPSLGSKALTTVGSTSTDMTYDPIRKASATS